MIQSFTIITTTPNEVCAPIHDRMPVIVDPANYGKWLGEEPADPARLLSFFKPFLAEAMERQLPRRNSRNTSALRVEGHVVGIAAGSNLSGDCACGRVEDPEHRRSAIGPISFAVSFSGVSRVRCHKIHTLDHRHT